MIPTAILSGLAAALLVGFNLGVILTLRMTKASREYVRFRLSCVEA